MPELITFAFLLGVTLFFVLVLSIEQNVGRKIVLKEARTIGDKKLHNLYITSLNYLLHHSKSFARFYKCIDEKYFTDHREKVRSEIDILKTGKREIAKKRGDIAEHLKAIKKDSK